MREAEPSDVYWPEVMTYNIRTNGEIWDVILDAKQVVIGSLGKSASMKKSRSEHSSRMQTDPEMANAHLSIFKVVTGE